MIDTSLIPKPKNTTKIVKKLGTTQDIIDSIIRVDRKYRSAQFNKFAEQFNTPDGLKRLWNFVKYEIEYKKDDFDKSLQLTPAALWKKKSGDCKSKTLFVNAVLRALNIPYIIRFTNYNHKNKDVKHVYTVAVINGKELPIDTVYNVFGKEKKFVHKKDYPMAEIVEVSGFARVDLTKPTKREIAQAKEESKKIIQKRQQEIRQKQRYVKPAEPIPFNKITEADATLRIMKDELELIKVFKPEKAKLVDKGLSLIYKAMHGDFSCTGDIPNELAGTICKIKMAENQQHRSAMSFGFNQEKLNILNKRRKEDERLSRISGAANHYCFEHEMFIQRKVDINNMVLNPNGGIQYIQNDFFNPTGMQWSNTGIVGACTNPNTNSLGNKQDFTQEPAFYPKGATSSSRFGNTGGSNFFNTIFDYPTKYNIQQPWTFTVWKTLQPGGTTNEGALAYAMNNPQWYTDNYMDILYGDVSYLTYGHKSKYRKTFFDIQNDFNQAIQKAIDDGLMSASGNNTGWYSFDVQTQTNLDIIVARLQESSGILNDLINDAYVTGNASGGALGNVLLYSFLNSTNRNPNDYPNQVQIKGMEQSQFISSCQQFSGVSQSNIKGLARNGILYSSGAEQPESILQTCLGLSEGTQPTNINAPGVVEVLTLIIGIVAALSPIIVEIISSVNRGNELKFQADQIDALAKQDAKFPPLDGVGPSEQDWQITLAGMQQAEEEAEEDRKKQAMLMGGGLLAAVLLMGDDKK